MVSLDAVYERLKECAAPFKLVLVDACRNDPRPGGARSLTATEGTKQLARSLQQIELPEGVVLLNSCAAGEISWEEEKFGHGVFMHFVLEGLAGAADVGGDQSVSLNELSDYVGPKTKAYVAQRFGYVQRPFFRGGLSTAALNHALLPLSEEAIRQRMAAADPNAKPWVGALIGGELYAEVVLINVLRDTPAARAGLQNGDHVVAVAGTKVGDPNEFLKAIAAHRPGETIDFGLQRGDRLQTVPVKLEAAPAAGVLTYVQMHADAGEAWAFTHLGWKAWNENKPDEAIDWFRRAAEADDPEGLLAMADMHARQALPDHEPAQIIRYAERARSAAKKSGHHQAFGLATVGLADLYYFGRSVPQDEAKAVDLYRAAAAVGHLGALYKLGDAYHWGNGVSKDLVKARGYFQQAAEAKAYSLRRQASKKTFVACSECGSSDESTKFASGSMRSRRNGD